MNHLSRQSVSLSVLNWPLEKLAPVPRMEERLLKNNRAYSEVLGSVRLAVASGREI